MAVGHEKTQQTCVSSAKKSVSFFSGSAEVPPAEESIHSCSEERKSVCDTYNKKTIPIIMFTLVIYCCCVHHIL